MLGSSYQRPQKDAVRRGSFEVLGERARPYRSILTLPSREALCVKAMRDAGLIDDRTRQVWIERDRKRVHHLEREAARIGGDITIVVCDLEDYRPDRTFDFVNADMESTVTLRLARWFERMGEHLDPGTDLVLTVTKWSRRNPLHHWLCDHLSKTCLYEPAARLRVRMGEFSNGVVVPMALLHSALRFTSVEHITLFDYGDDGRTKMASMVLQNIQGRETSWPTLDRVLADCPYSVIPQGERGAVVATLFDRVKQTLADLFMVVEQERDGWAVYFTKNGRSRINTYGSLDEIAAAFQVET